MRTSPFSRGFTLPELLVSLFVFSLAILGAISLVVSAISVQKRSGVEQELMDQASYIAEYMSRALRQARKDTGPTCLSQSGRNYEVSNNGTDWFVDTSGTWVRFLDRNDQCHVFFLETQRIKERIALVEQYITSNNLQATILGFVIKGADQTDDLQPKATFAIELKGKVLQAGFQPVVRLQTTVSQRNVDAPK